MRRHRKTNCSTWKNEWTQLTHCQKNYWRKQSQRDKIFPLWKPKERQRKNSCQLEAENIFSDSEVFDAEIRGIVAGIPQCEGECMKRLQGHKWQFMCWFSNYFQETFDKVLIRSITGSPSSWYEYITKSKHVVNVLQNKKKYNACSLYENATTAIYLSGM